MWILKYGSQMIWYKGWIQMYEFIIHISPQFIDQIFMVMISWHEFKEFNTANQGEFTIMNSWFWIFEFCSETWEMIMLLWIHYSYLCYEFFYEFDFLSIMYNVPTWRMPWWWGLEMFLGWHLFFQYFWQWKKNSLCHSEIWEKLTLS